MNSPERTASPGEAEKLPLPRLSKGLALAVDLDLVRSVSAADRAAGELAGAASMLSGVDGVVHLFALTDAAGQLAFQAEAIDLLDLLEAPLQEADEPPPTGILLASRYAEILAGDPAGLFDQGSMLSLMGRLHRECYHDLTDRAGMVRTGDLPEEPVVPGRRRTEYQPPTGQALKSLLVDLDGFLQENQRLPLLVQAAVMEARWALLQPFREGSGLMQRLLLHLFLRENDVLPLPLCSLGEVYRQHRVEYAFTLRAVESENRWDDWIQFFLRSVTERCRRATGILQAIQTMRRQHREAVRVLPGNTDMALRMLEHLYRQPLVNIQYAADHLDVVFGTANTLLRNMEEAGLVREITGQRRNKRYLYTGYVELFTEEPA